MCSLKLTSGITPLLLSVFTRRLLIVVLIGYLFALMQHRMNRSSLAKGFSPRTDTGLNLHPVFRNLRLQRRCRLRRTQQHTSTLPPHGAAATALLVCLKGWAAFSALLRGAKLCLVRTRTNSLFSFELRMRSLQPLCRTFFTLPPTPFQNYSILSPSRNAWN